MNREPVSRELFDEVMVPNYAPGTIIPVRGEGSRVWDQEGREFVDLQGGIAVTSLGHAHPGLIPECGGTKHLRVRRNLLSQIQKDAARISHWRSFSRTRPSAGHHQRHHG